MRQRKGLGIASCYASRLVEGPHARARATVQCGFDVIARSRTVKTNKNQIALPKESIKSSPDRGFVMRSKIAKNLEEQPFLTDWSKCFAEDFAIGKKSSCQFGNGTWRRKRWSLTSKEDS
jgi:hypothetical protein